MWRRVALVRRFGVTCSLQIKFGNIPRARMNRNSNSPIQPRSASSQETVLLKVMKAIKTAVNIWRELFWKGDFSALRSAKQKDAETGESFRRCNRLVKSLQRELLPMPGLSNSPRMANQLVGHARESDHLFPGRGHSCRWARNVLRLTQPVEHDGPADREMRLCLSLASPLSRQMFTRLRY
jgi:hypothetical protein